MKKALSILLALVMVIGVFPTFADKKAEDKKAEKTAVQVSASEKALEALKGYGAIKGDGTADPFKMESELKRQNAAVILVRLLGVENEAKATEVKEKPFTDLPNDDFYKSIIQYVKAKGIFKGTTSEKFGFNEAITAQQFATINLRALGYEVDTDEAYGKALEQAKKLGLLKDASALENNTKIMRKDVYVIMNNTLETPKKGGKKALKYELGYATEPKVEKLEVVDAMANGLGVLKVEFTKPIDEDSLSTIEITDKDQNNVKKSTRLSEDKKTAILIVGEREQNETLKVVVENVKTEDRKEKVATKFEKKILFQDTDRPVVNSVEVLNPREMVIAVSEPIKLSNTSYAKYDEIKIDDKAVYAKLANDYDGKLTVTLYKALKEGEHKVMIEGLKDFAKLPSAAFEQDITVVDDKEAPVISEAKLLTANTIKVTFNENVEKLGQFKVNGDAVKSSNVKYQEVKYSKKDIVLTLDKELGMGAIVEIKVEYKGQKDIMGNEVKNWEKLTFSVADDTDLPTAEFKGFDKDDATKVQIQFSKAMNKEGEWKLKDGKGKVVQSGKVEGNTLVKYEGEEKDANKADKAVLVFKLKELKDKDPKDYTLVLEKFKDATVRHNEMPKTEITFKGKDTKLPEVVDKAYAFKYDEGQNIYTIAFTEKMNEDSLKDKTNYTIVKGAKETRLDQVTGTDVETRIKVLEDGRKVQVIIKAPKADYGDSVKIKLVGLKDENDQKLLPVTVELESDTDAPKVLGAADVTRNDSNEFFIKVKFDKKVRIDNTAKFTLSKGSLAFEGDVDNYSDEFTFSVEGVEFKDDLAGAPEFKIEKGAVKSSRDKENAGGKVALNDKLPARIAMNDKEEKLVTVESTNLREIAITFTEELASPVANAVVSLSATKDGKVVEITNKQLKNLVVDATTYNNRILTFEVPPMQNGDKYQIQVSVKDKNGVVSKVMSEDLEVSGLTVEVAPKLEGAKLTPGTVAGHTTLTVPTAVGGVVYKYQKGKHYPLVDEALATAGDVQQVVGTTADITPGLDTHVTVYETKGDKVVKSVILAYEGNVAVDITDLPIEVKIVAGSATPLTIDGDGSFIANAATTASNFADAATDKFAVKVEMKPGATNQTVKVEVTPGTGTLDAAFQPHTAFGTTPDIDVKTVGTFTVKVTVSETGKLDKVYTTELTIS